MESDDLVVKWCSDGKSPYNECHPDLDVHVFVVRVGGRYEGVLCSCGTTRWSYDTCNLCHQTRGKAVPI
jgi:hypothetical protein